MRRVQSQAAPARPGLGAAEVVVVLSIVVLLVLVVLMVLPRQREGARLASCQLNLMRIGQALAQYDQGQGMLPTIPVPGAGTGAADGSLWVLRDELGLAGVVGPAGAEPPRVPGFLCPSDPHASAGLFTAPIGYRATTGSEPDGRDGAFAPGRRMSLKQIEAADGAAYTAAFAERLVGDNVPAHPAPENYARVAGPLEGAAGCPAAPAAAWRGDAGASWRPANWQSTLYNHALTPGAATSCIAADGRSAFMGSSSGHVGGVNVLIFDGSVQSFTTTIDPRIWRAWATVPEAPRESP